MRPRIVFLIMSAVHSPSIVDQLARALAPHVVLVHHDFAQTPDFVLMEPNVAFVPNPKRTGWSFFGFVDGIFHSFQYAMEHLEFDYLQVLSPTCLPIKPIEQFEAHLSKNAEAHFSGIDILADRDALMSVGYRVLTPERSIRHRIARWLSRQYFGASTKRREEAGVWIRSGFAADRSGQMTSIARFAFATMRALSSPLIGRHIFDESLRPYFGTTWVGARRSVIGRMIEEFQRPGIREYFSRLQTADEFLFPTLLKRCVVKSEPMNHYIQTFDDARPGWIEMGDFEAIRNSAAFFARKFPDDPCATIRTRVLRELVGVKPGATRTAGDAETTTDAGFGV